MNLKNKTTEELSLILAEVERELKSRKEDTEIIRDRRFLQEFLADFPDHEVAFFTDEEDGFDVNYALMIKHKKLSKWISIDVAQFASIYDENWYVIYSKIVPAQMSEVMEGVYEYRGKMDVEEYLNKIGFRLF